jgi:hypothetical protein
MFCSFPSRIADRRRTAVGWQTVNQEGCQKQIAKRVARFLPFPLRATFEGTLNRLEELPGKVGMIENHLTAAHWSFTRPGLEDQQQH